MKRLINCCDLCGQPIEYCLCEDVDTECDCEGCEYCDECEEVDDETQEEIKLIEHLAHSFEESDCTCGACLRNTLYEAYAIGRGIGRQDITDSFRGLLDTIDECR